MTDMEMFVRWFAVVCAAFSLSVGIAAFVQSPDCRRVQVLAGAIIVINTFALWLAFG